MKRFQSESEEINENIDEEKINENIKILDEIYLLINNHLFIKKKEEVIDDHSITYTEYIDSLKEILNKLNKLKNNPIDKITLYNHIHQNINNFIEYVKYELIESSKGSKKSFLELLGDFYDNLKIDKDFRDLYDEDKYVYTRIMIDYHYQEQYDGGKSQKLKKTDDKIKVLYKKKEYTRVIYVNKNKKKFVKINKQILELSKLKKS